jgi:hypothetical protein
MTDRSRRGLVSLFAPAIAALQNPVVRDGYAYVLTRLTGSDPLAILVAVHRATPRPDPEAYAALRALLLPVPRR